MSREIKFRAWDPKRKEMRESFVLHQANGAVPLIGQGNGGDLLPQLDWTVVQFTGLKDKNGKEIYEGDIVASVHYDPNFESHQAEYSGPDVDMDLTLDNVVSFEKGTFVLENNCVGDFYRENIVIVGNIYQNPELLEVKP